jgi:hypothetical protein
MLDVDACGLTIRVDSLRLPEKSATSVLEHVIKTKGHRPTGKRRYPLAAPQSAPYRIVRPNRVTMARRGQSLEKGHR